MSKPPPEASGRFAYDGLDRIIHEKARLSILTTLISYPKGVAFADLRKLCGLTDGNLSRHLTILEAAKLIAIAKSFVDQRPHTVCRVTALGRKRYLEYLAVLEQVVRDAAAAAGHDVAALSAKPSPA
jgi:DNA-binding MarR family transcriptional regulator